MRDDPVAIANRFFAIDQIRQLSARCKARVEDVTMLEIHPAQTHERKYLETEGIVVGDAKQVGIRIKRQHEALLARGRHSTRKPLLRRAEVSGYGAPKLTRLAAERHEIGVCVSCAREDDIDLIGFFSRRR